MDVISSAEFNEICHDCSLKLIKYGRGTQPKVFEKNGNTIIKLFYPKQKWLSSTRIKPQAMRFHNNVIALRQRGYDVPHILNIQHCADLKTYLIHYAKIEGEDVRALVKNGSPHLIQDVARLVAHLHANGIFFRSIHLENLLYKPDGSFALIDITDVKFKHKPLNVYLRYRNLKHLFSDPNDRDIWQAFGIDRFLSLYFAAAVLPDVSRRLITYFIKRAIDI